jgi:tRNA (adenine57-N1/adenine58-N1)-methyltransferase
MTPESGPDHTADGSADGIVDGIVNEASMRRGPLRVADRVVISDVRGRRHVLLLEAGKVFFTHRGALAHDDLIGQPEGSVITSSEGATYLAMRPSLSEHVMTMPRGAALVYPKDAAAIVGLADIYPGCRVLEAGAGSGSLTSFLLRAVGNTGSVTSFERRADFAETAAKNVTKFFGTRPANWSLIVGDLAEGVDLEPADRVVLDMLAPWDCLDVVARAIEPGGVIVTYLATTTQMSRFVETLRVDGRWTEPQASETMVRTWHIEGLAVRPDHRMVGHTGFLVVARRLADGASLPAKRSRPAKGAYGDDYEGPQVAGTTGDSADAEADAADRPKRLGRASAIPRQRGRLP